MKGLNIFVLACAAALPLYANAAVSVDARGLVSFVHLDSDNNGYVSRVEARSVSGVERAFDTADENRDGLLDRGEYIQVQQPGKAR